MRPPTVYTTERGGAYMVRRNPDAHLTPDLPYAICLRLARAGRWIVCPGLVFASEAAADAHIRALAAMNGWEASQFDPSIGWKTEAAP